MHGGQRIREEIHVECDILLWGYRVIVVTNLKPAILSKLHASYMRVAKVKSLARSFVWRLNADQEIWNTKADCATCNVTRVNPNTDHTHILRRDCKTMAEATCYYLYPFNGHY